MQPDQRRLFLAQANRAHVRLGAGVLLLLACVLTLGTRPATGDDIKVTPTVGPAEVQSAKQRFLALQKKELDPQLKSLIDQWMKNRPKASPQELAKELLKNPQFQKPETLEALKNYQRELQQALPQPAAKTTDSASQSTPTAKSTETSPRTASKPSLEPPQQRPSPANPAPAPDPSRNRPAAQPARQTESTPGQPETRPKTQPETKPQQPNPRPTTTPNPTTPRPGENPLPTGNTATNPGTNSSERPETSRGTPGATNGPVRQPPLSPSLPPPYAGPDPASTNPMARPNVAERQSGEGQSESEPGRMEGGAPARPAPAPGTMDQAVPKPSQAASQENPSPSPSPSPPPTTVTSPDRDYRTAVAWWEKNFGPIDKSPAMQELFQEFFKGNLASGRSPFESLVKGATLPDLKLPTSSLPKGVSLPGMNLGGAGNLPDTPAINLPSGPNWSLPGVGNLDLAGLPTVAVALVLVVIVAGCWLWWTRQTWQPWRSQRPTPLPGLGPWPIDPRAIRSRADLIVAFEYLSVFTLGAESIHFHHGMVARGIAALKPDLAHRAEQVARGYMLARYSPPETELTTAEITTARAALCALAEVPA